MLLDKNDSRLLIPWAQVGFAQAEDPLGNAKAQRSGTALPIKLFVIARRHDVAISHCFSGVKDDNDISSLFQQRGTGLPQRTQCTQR